MSDKVLKGISEELKRIAGANSIPIMSGKVISVNEGTGTCVVQLSVDEQEAPTPGVMLNAVKGNSSGVMLIPAANSQVLVAEVDGPGKWSLIKCSTLVKMVVTIGSVKLTLQNDEAFFDTGSNNGLVKIVPLVSKINAIETVINNLLSAVTAVVIAGTLADAAAVKAAIMTGLGTGIIPLTMQADIENTKVKH